MPHIIAGLRCRFLCVVTNLFLCFSFSNAALSIPLSRRIDHDAFACGLVANKLDEPAAAHFESPPPTQNSDRFVQDKKATKRALVHQLVGKIKPEHSLSHSSEVGTQRGPRSPSGGARWVPFLNFKPHSSTVSAPVFLPTRYGADGSDITVCCPVRWWCVSQIKKKKINNDKHTGGYGHDHLPAADVPTGSENCLVVEGGERKALPLAEAKKTWPWQWPACSSCVLDRKVC